MSERYKARDMDTHGAVWDCERDRTKSTHSTLAAAEAEAARLNAETPKRCAPYFAWIAVDVEGFADSASCRSARIEVEKYLAADAARWPNVHSAKGWRIARVEIREISDDE